MIAIPAMTRSVLPALRACGCRNAVTPFEIDSTPVSAADPDANAFKRTKRVSVPVPTATGCGTVATGAIAEKRLHDADREDCVERGDESVSWEGEKKT